MLKKLFIYLTVFCLLTSSIVMANEAIISGKATYLERIALPSNAIFQATLEDVSLMDVPSVTLGETIVSPAGQVPISFAIKYDNSKMQKGHRYSVRGRITVDDKLLYTTDTMNSVLNGKDSSKLQIVLKRVKMKPVKKDNIHMFPKAQKGFVRHVIELAKMDNDNDHQVELMIGKTMLVDCNRHSLRGKITKVNLKGWGYTYLEVSNIQSGPSTMMACPEEKTEKFITILSNKARLHRYNSRLPIIIYVPDGYEVRYRIWSAGDKTLMAKQR